MPTTGCGTTSARTQPSSLTWRWVVGALAELRRRPGERLRGGGDPRVSPAGREEVAGTRQPAGAVLSAPRRLPLTPPCLPTVQAEGAYTKAALADTEELQEELYKEMRGRIQEADQSAPLRCGAAAGLGRGSRRASRGGLLPRPLTLALTPAPAFTTTTPSLQLPRVFLLHAHAGGAAVRGAQGTPSQQRPGSGGPVQRLGCAPHPPGWFKSVA